MESRNIELVFEPKCLQNVCITSSRKIGRREGPSRLSFRVCWTLCNVLRQFHGRPREFITREASGAMKKLPRETVWNWRGGGGPRFTSDSGGSERGGGVLWRGGSDIQTLWCESRCICFSSNIYSPVLRLFRRSPRLEGLFGWESIVRIVSFTLMKFYGITP